jgi:hypothetical protein
MPHPWVYSATTTADGKITFRVEVTDLQTTQGAIEITGVATQVVGAFAPIFQVANIEDAIKGDPDDEDQAGKLFVDVQAEPTQDHAFDPKEDVTVFVRVSKVWVTVLGPGIDEQKGSPGPGPNTAPAPTWGKHRADAHMNAPAAGTPAAGNQAAV